MKDITDRTRHDVEVARARTPLDALRARARDCPPTRGFIAALTPRGDSDTRVIAEVKRRSPSAGLIRPEYVGDGFSPERIAREYHRAGAAAISCLTDSPFFGGDISFVERIRAEVPIPVLRKDFIIDPWQVWQSRVAGADAVLLIAECLPGEMLAELASLAQSLGLATLLEIHDEVNLERSWAVVAASRGRALLGINNRDLSSMRVDLDHTTRLADRVGDRSALVSESGIKTPKDLAKLREFGVRRVLVGEHLMRQPDPGAALVNLLAPHEGVRPEYTR